MSDNGDSARSDGHDALEYQTAYVYTPVDVTTADPIRPPKRQKLTNKKQPLLARKHASEFKFEALLNGNESIEVVRLRQQLFRSSWAETERRIESVLQDANEGTLSEVTCFVTGAAEQDNAGRIPTGFIAIGPNIASQNLLFKQLSARLKSESNGPVITLTSGDAPNLKTALKHIIRDALNQLSALEDLEQDTSPTPDGRKLLNYDLETLHPLMKSHQRQHVVIVFQDSEGFDAGLVGDLIILFNSWADRIPFLLLFGIATSVNLFQERLSRAATRCIYGAQFDVEQTSIILEKVFQKTVANPKSLLRLGISLLSSLLERQDDFLQSVQSFTSALKYAYMCHFYGNPLSFLIDDEAITSKDLLQPVHYKAVRTLPSFKKLVEHQLTTRQLVNCRDLLEDNTILHDIMLSSLLSRHQLTTHLLRVIHLLTVCSPEPIGKIELYLAAFGGNLGGSTFVRRTLDSIKKMAPDAVLKLLRLVKLSIEEGSPDMELEGWSSEASEVIGNISTLHERVMSLTQESKRTGTPVRSSYDIQSKGIRTTVIAQRVQLSYKESTLSIQDKEFTSLVDELSDLLATLLVCKDPRDVFLHEIWIYDEEDPYEIVFTPRPRNAIERALASPHRYLSCDCCKIDPGVSAKQPASASMYQLCLEAGSLVNIFDLWRAFLDTQNPEDSEEFDEREALVLFYRGLADLKLLGIVKHSKKKVDHLAKAAFNGL